MEDRTKLRMGFALFKYFPHGGLQKDMLRLVQCALDRGHHVEIATSEWKGEMISHPNCSLHLIALRSRSNHGRALEFEQKYQEHLHACQFDLTLTFNRMNGCDFYFAADNCLAVELPKSHSTWMLGLFARYRTYLQMEADLMSPANRTMIMHITERQKNDFRRMYHTQEERFLSLPPGMDPACRRPPDAEEIRSRKRQELGVAEEELMILHVGANFVNKGGKRILDAYDALPVFLKQKTKIFHAGKQSRTKSGNGSHMTFLGERNDVSELMLAADLLLHPAWNEAAGSVLVEAISAGLPVVCTEECGFSNFVKDSGGIVVSSPFSKPEFLTAVTDSLEHHVERRRHAIEFAGCVDYTTRAQVALDFLEAFAKSKEK